MPGAAVPLHVTGGEAWTGSSFTTFPRARRLRLRHGAPEMLVPGRGGSGCVDYNSRRGTNFAFELADKARFELYVNCHPRRET